MRAPEKISVTTALPLAETQVELATSDNSAVEREKESTSARISGGRTFREQQRRLRIHGKLIDMTLNDLSVLRGGRYDFFIEKMIVCIRGSHSQFDTPIGRSKNLMPPLTHDCCQTFSTLAAILLSSLGFAVTMQECSDVSTVNYLLYISAWLHQLSAPAWPQKKMRPTISDLNASLKLRDFFPCRINEGEFEVVFYNQQGRVKELVNKLCVPLKRGRDDADDAPVCGYVIASGDYTVSIFSLAHDIKNRSDTRNRNAWSLYVCDSHGTQPWSNGKACLTGVNFSVPVHLDNNEASSSADNNGEMGYFTMILLALLEYYRGKTENSRHVPYMTWSPIRRERVAAKTAEELRSIIDDEWLPALLSGDIIAQEVKRFKFTPVKCFFGISGAKKN